VIVVFESWFWDPRILLQCCSDSKHPWIYRTTEEQVKLKVIKLLELSATINLTCLVNVIFYQIYI